MKHQDLRLVESRVYKLLVELGRIGGYGLMYTETGDVLTTEFITKAYIVMQTLLKFGLKWLLNFSPH